MTATKKRAVAIVSIATYLLGSTVFGALPVGVAATDTKSHKISFNIPKVISLTMSGGDIAFGNVAPDTDYTASRTLTVKSNATYSLSYDSWGNNNTNIDADDAFFMNASGTPNLDTNAIPISRLKINTVELDGDSANIATGQTRTNGRDHELNYLLRVQYQDLAGDGYATNIVYTATN